jgi:uncharacterized protein YxeA
MKMKKLLVAVSLALLIIFSSTSVINRLNAQEVDKQVKNIKITDDYKDSDNVGQQFRFGQNNRSTQTSDFNVESRLIDYFGKEITVVSVRYYTKYFQSFDEVKETILKTLSAQPKRLYGYQPWAEGVSLNISCTIEFADGNQSNLEIGSIGALGVNRDGIKSQKMFNYVCFQKDANYLWFRL